MEKMLLRWLIFTLLLSVNAIAQEEQVLSVEDIRQLKEKLLYEFKKYETTQDVDLSEVIGDLNSRTENYIKYRKQECAGDFSSIELNDKGEKILKKKKLNKTEKKLCMLELINFQRKFTNVIYSVRKSLLQKQHKQQLESLEKYRQQNIDELEKIASKYK
jgi:hypothetical protein